MKTVLSVAVEAAFKECEKQGKVFDGQKVGMALRAAIPIEQQAGPHMLADADAEKIGRACVH